MAQEQLWAKDLPLDQAIHRFTVGEDPSLDLELYPHDCVASAAHARMLCRVGLLSEADTQQLVSALKRQYQLSLTNQIRIDPLQEDCHTAIEAGLTEQLGEVGKRIHLGRSRNDQVMVALRLWCRSQYLNLGWRIVKLARVLIAFGRRHAELPLPGYTHMRRAMPSTYGMWALGFAEGLLEELEAGEGLYRRLDRCPLGAAAGFGVPLPIDRAFTAQLLGFTRVQRSPVDVMNSRGRHEQALLDWLVSSAATWEKLLWDLVIYSTEEFGYIKLPEAFTTGSSIMPNKRNPDVVEIARAKCRELRGISEMHRQIMTGLPSSYHRDFQLGKAPLLAGVKLAETLLGVMTRLVPVLQPDAARAQAAHTDELYAAHAAYQLVAEGLAFREAYKVTSAQLSDGSFKPDRDKLKATHIGGAGDLQIEQIENELLRREQLLVSRTRQDMQMREDIWILEGA